MIANLQPYPTYKPSGVECLGDAPAHWEVERLGNIGQLTKGSGGTKEDEVPSGIPCVRYGDLYTTHDYFIEASRSFVAPDAANIYTSISLGDVLFAGSGETIEEIGKSAVNLIPGQACCGGDVILFKPGRELVPRFMGYATGCVPATSQKAAMGRGITIMHIYGNQLKLLAIPLPPLPEQAAIVRYLDHVDQRIQRYIHAKEQLIALLEEEKQAIINQAVTRGLDPNVPLKPSGVEWLGDVPAHWQVRRLEQIGRFSKGNGGTKGDESTEGLPCVRYGDIYMHHKYFIESTRSRIPEERAQVYTPIQYGDLLFAGSGETIEEIGKSAVNLMEEEAYCGGDVILFRPTGHINPRFVGYASDCTQATFQKSTMGRGITVMHIYSSQLKYLALAFPPLAEQRAIVEHVDKATKGIEVAVIRSRRQIDLLEEYRTRLVSDVVTGKLDVREAAANLPGAPTPPLDPDGPAHGSSAPIADAVLHDVR